MTSASPATGARSLVLPPRLDATNAETVSASLLTQLQAGEGNSPVTVDAAALQSFDSSALALLLALQRAAAERGMALALQAAPVRLVELARLYGVEALLHAVPPEAATA